MDFSGKLYVAIKAWFDNIYDLYVNPTPKNVVLQNAKVDEQGNVSDVTIPNIAMLGKKVDDFIDGGVKNYFSRSANVTNVTIWDTLLTLPSGGSLTITLTEDISWDREVSLNNVNLIIQLNGHKLNLVERNFHGNPFIYGINGGGNIVTIDGKNKDGSILELPIATLTGNSVHGSFLFSLGVGFADANTLALGYGVEVVDNGDFYLISTKAGSALSLLGVTLSSATREWKDLIYGVQLVNGVPKNFSTNIALT